MPFFTITGSGAVTVGNNDFATGAMSLADTASFTQTGDNGAVSFSQSVASLSTAAGTTCVWDNNNNGGSLRIEGNVDAGATISFNLKNVQIGGTVSGSIEVYDLHIYEYETLTLNPSSSLTVRRSILIDANGDFDGTAAGAQLIWGGPNSVTGGTYTDSNTTPVNLDTFIVDSSELKTLLSHLGADSLTIGDTIATTTLLAGGFPIAVETN